MTSLLHGASHRLGEEIKEMLVDPYLSADGNQVRLSMRIYEADEGLNRDALLREIRTHLVEQMGYQPDRVHLTGMLVLYNNVLQSLYRSQILTLGAVFLAITSATWPCLARHSGPSMWAASPAT